MLMLSAEVRLNYVGFGNGRIALMRLCLLLLVSSLAMSTQSPNKAIVTVGMAPTLPDSHAVKAGGLIYLAGVLAQDANGRIVPKGDIKGQTKRVIERMRDVLPLSGRRWNRSSP